MRKLISISLLLITTLIFGQSPMIGLVSNASIVNPVTVPFEIVSYEITEITSTTARVVTYMNEQCSIDFYVDGIKNAASSDDFNASTGWPEPGTFRHGRTLTGLTPDTTTNLVIKVTAQDDLELVQSGNIPLTTLPTPTGVAVLSNFRVENLTPTLVHFDASASISGLPVTGFKIEGILINSITIDGDNLGGYFTLSASLNFWDNILIRLEGGAGTIVRDFTLQYIENLIDEPTNSTVKYVAVGGTGSGNTIGDPMVWTSAQTVANGTTVWWKAGNYGSINFVQVNPGTSANPIKHIGYKTYGVEVGSLDRRNLIDGVDSFDATEMPLLQNGAGIAFTPKDYTIVRNFQVDDYGTGYGVYAHGNDYCIYDNIYIRDTQFGIWSNSTTQRNNRIINSLTVDVYKNAIKIGDRNNLVDNVWAASTSIIDEDYYITIKGGPTGHSNNVRNCRVERFLNDTHSGHGISFKSDQYVAGYVIEHSLIEDCVLIHDQVEMRHLPTKYNVIRNVSITSSYKTSALISRDGATHNTFEGIVANGVSTFHVWYETPEYTTSDPNSSDNTFINCVADYAERLFNTGSYGSTQASIIERNAFINCTFKNITDIYNTASIEVDNTNTFTNCIFDTCASLGSGDLNAVFSYSDFYSANAAHWSYTAEAGTGNFVENPLLDAITYQPQATFTTIDVPPVSGVYYDKNGLKRNTTLTTTGAVLHTIETP